MQKLYNLINDLRIPIRIKQTFFLFSKKEWFLFIFFLILLIISTLGILNKISQYYTKEKPLIGGSFKEGIIGSPRFINPILATSEADKDMVNLIYGGLLKKDSTGKTINDLAESYNISEDGLIYTFKIKEKINFHDGTPVTSEDIIFTINAIKNPDNKSPYKTNWDGISLEKIDEKTIQFVLKQKNYSFIENLTIGIMPKKIWENSIIELNDANLNPVGTGPYKVKSFTKQSSGIINGYELESYKKYNLDRPYITNIYLKFYSNEEELLKGLNAGEIEQASSISPKNAKDFENKKHTITTSVLPRIFGIFFNQNQNQIFLSKNIKEAIELAIDKEQIIEEVLLGYGTVISNPIPPNLTEYERIDSKNKTTREEKIKKAIELIEKDGWKKNESGFFEKSFIENKKKTTQQLEFIISTSNIKDLSDTALIIQNNLAEIGINIEIQTFELGNLNQMVIRPRKYDSLLFGQVISKESDLYAFWHSSQRKDPGINISSYVNQKVDNVLEKLLSGDLKQNKKEEYIKFEEEIRKDKPAIFLYSPEFIYITSNNIKNISIENIVSPQDRFSDVHKWYIKTEKVWKIFLKD